MARVTFAADGMGTLEEVGRWLALAEAAGFPLGSPVDSPSSGVSGARLSVTTRLNLLPFPTVDDDEPEPDE